MFPKRDSSFSVTLQYVDGLKFLDFTNPYNSAKDSIYYKYIFFNMYNLIIITIQLIIIQLNYLIKL